jgi:hypothetical protein
MQAVVFKGPLKVALEERPIPQIQHPTDVIVKVRYTALCGRYVYLDIPQHSLCGDTRYNDCYNG